MLKKSIAIFCFTALLFSTSSLSLFYWVQEQWHEQERLASIDAGKFKSEHAQFINIDSKAHQIKLYLKDNSILPKGYYWEEEGREFSHEGMFYDIVSLTKTDTGWELVAVSDEEEAEIVAKQSKVQHVDKELTNSKKSSKSKLNFNFSVYDSFFEQPLCQVCLILNVQASPYYMDRLSQQILDHISPPPEVV